MTIALALFLAAQAAVADADRADGRCAATMSMAADTLSGDDKTALESGMMFYLGRISGRSGAAAVGPALEAGAADLEEADVTGIVEECAGQLEAITAGM